ncbi:MAG: DUF418 domain-containing protein, partial [Hyphomonadaceae bacterium]
GVFGALHGALIWSGDVLLMYALCGALVYVCRAWRAPALCAAGVALYAASSAFSVIQGAALIDVAPDRLAQLRAQIWAPSAQTLAAEQAAFRGDLIAVTRANLAAWLEFVRGGLPFAAPRAIALMMLGLGLFKLGFFEGRLRRSFYLACLAAGAVALVAIALQARESAALGFPFLYMYAQGMGVNLFLAPLVSIAYAAIIVLFGAPRALAAVGRMALTNYIAQSLIMTTLFWGGRGFGLYGEIDRAGLMAIVPLVWAAQLIWSPLWLRRFQYGPLEWAWRSLTYQRKLSLRRS